MDGGVFLVKVMVDIDGVIFDIHSYIEELIRENNVDPNYSQKNILTYDINKSLVERLDKVFDEHWKGSPELGSIYKDSIRMLNYISRDTRDVIFTAFKEPEIFQGCKVDMNAIGIIKNLIAEGAEVVFHTVSLSDEVKQVKEERIKELLKGYEGEYEFCSCNNICEKCSDEYDYVIEDCLETLAEFSKINDKAELLLIAKSYNSPIMYSEYSQLFETRIKQYANTESALMYVFGKEYM